MSSVEASRNTPTTFDNLPQETAVNIFLRLPVKALIRSTSVNKTWYSLITNPNFISAQIKHSISHCNQNAVLIIPPCLSQEKHCSLISVETSKLIEKFEVPFKTRSGSLNLVDSVNGILLLTDSHLLYNSRDLYLWNPCVKTHRTLVSSCFKKLLDNPLKSYCIVGLGFHKASNDYRVVRIVYVGDNRMNYIGQVAPKVEVYSLRKQTWKKIKDPVVPRIASKDGVYVDGSFYWLEMKPPATQEGGRCYNSKELWMLSFDFDNEVFGELKFPKKVSNCLGASGRFKLMEFEDSLCLCVFDVQHTNGVTIHPYRIWLMRQENGVISWILRFRAALEEGGWPLNITKSGTILIETYPFLGRVDVTGMLSCNLKTMHYKNLGFGRRGGEEDSLFMPEPCTVDTSFMESLVMYEGGKSLLKFAK